MERQNGQPGTSFRQDNGSPIADELNGCPVRIRTRDANNENSEVHQRRTKAPWCVDVPVEALDARNAKRNKIAGLRPGLKLMMMILDGHARDLPYTWVGNELLAAKYGCTERRVKEMLADLEARDLIERVVMNGPPPEFTARIGIIMRERADPKRPRADTEAARRAARAALKECREARGSPAARGKKSAPARGKKSSPAEGEEKFPQKTSLSLKTTHAENNAAEAAALERQRQEPEPLPTPIPDPEPAAVCTSELPSAPTAEPAQEVSSMATRHIGAVLGDRFPFAQPATVGLTPRRQRPAELSTGQKDWLARLTEDQRAAFDAKSPRGQAELLAPHEHRVNCDPIIVADQAAKLTPRGAPPPAPPLPATTAELLMQLPGASADWPQKAAELLTQEFGAAADRQLWGEFLKITQAVRDAAFPADLVVNAYRQATRGRDAKGRPIEKPGAKFWAALKCLAERNGFAL